MKNIIFYGALGSKTSNFVGGGENGNFKTIDILEKKYYNVIKLHKPYPKKSKLAIPLYIVSIYIVVFKLIFKIIKYKPCAVHISGFYMHLIYQESILVLFTKLFKVKCIYELRGGGVDNAYYNGSILYKMIFKLTINNATIVLSQGSKYIELIKKLGAKNVIYYPNCISNKHILNTKYNKQENNTHPKIVFFGRITETKNIIFMIDVCKILNNNNFNFQLNIIGEGGDEYINEINNKILKYNLKGKINLKPPLFGKELITEINSNHFFLFPTKEPREGHSNSLTEAMALGIVPICSNYGFNKEIVNNENLIITNFDPNLYAQKIINIWNNKLWHEYSTSVRNNIISNYTSQIVSEYLLLAYK